MEAEGPVNNGPQGMQRRNNKRKQPQHSADIVFTKGTAIQTMPSLSKVLKAATENIIGLQYVWEYRSPSKSVPPHYQCKLCAVSRLQHDMVAHVKGWKHSFRYLKKVHPDKVTCEEEEAVKDPAVRKTIREAATEVEKLEGRGQLKVILKEPCEVIAFKGLRSAAPKIPPLAPMMGPMGPNGPPPFGPRFPPHGPPDYPVGEYEDPSFGGYPAGKDFHNSGMDRRPFSDGLGPRPAGDGYGPGGGGDGYRRGGLLETPGRSYPDEYRGSQVGGGLLDRPADKPLERPSLMGAAPESSNLPNKLLHYLDSFRIENENDAQLVLKVTQKLTDVLMEYRLRSVSSGSSLSSFSMSSTNFSSTPSRLPSSDRYSSNLSGPNRFSDGPSRFYK